MINATNYTCGFCKKTYAHLNERMSCENQCFKEQEIVKKQQEQEEFLKSQKADFDKLTVAKENYINLNNEYIEKYGHGTFPISKIEDSALLHNIIRTLRL